MNPWGGHDGTVLMACFTTGMLRRPRIRLQCSFQKHSPPKEGELTTRRFLPTVIRQINPSHAVALYFYIKVMPSIVLWNVYFEWILLNLGNRIYMHLAMGASAYRVRWYSYINMRGCSDMWIRVGLLRVQHHNIYTKDWCPLDCAAPRVTVRGFWCFLILFGGGLRKGEFVFRIRLMHSSTINHER